MGLVPTQVDTTEGSLVAVTHTGRVLDPALNSIVSQTTHLSHWAPILISWWSTVISQ